MQRGRRRGGTRVGVGNPDSIMRRCRRTRG
jgi:hypothetical protein